MNKTVKAVVNWLRNDPPGLISLEPESDLSEPIATCRCCGTPSLCWGKYQGKWRLFENGTLHCCPTNPLILETGQRMDYV